MTIGVGLVDALNSVRVGTPTDDAVTLFESLARELPVEHTGDGGRMSKFSQLLPTELFPTRQAVKSANDRHLNNLPAEAYPFRAKDVGSKNFLDGALLVEEELVLKVGAQVMLVKNMDNVLVNGSVGKVLGFYEPKQLRSTGQGKKTGALLRDVELGEDGRAVLRESKTKRRREDVVRLPLVLFQYPKRGAVGEVKIEAVLLKPEIFHADGADGKSGAKRTQM